MLVEDLEASDPKSAVMYPDSSGILVSGATRVRPRVRVRVRVRVRLGVRVRSRVRIFGDFPTFFSDFPTHR